MHSYQLVRVVLGWLMEPYIACLCGMIVAAARVVDDSIRNCRLSLQQREEVLEEDGVVVVLLWVLMPRDVNLHGINLMKGRAG